jgi:hypothetical protein
MGSYTYKSKPYSPKQQAAYKLSRSKIDLYIQCKRCFYLDVRLTIKRPSIPAFTLNSAVDQLLKSEFDSIRRSGGQHPIQTEYKVDARPVNHDKLNDWRENFKGVQALHEPTNLLICGAIDDLWQDSNGDYIVVDYKATSKNSKIEQLDDSRWHDQYRRQLEVYQWLLRRNDLSVSDVGYFIYCNGIKNKDGFDAKLEFEITLIPYKGNGNWIDQTLVDIKKCIDSEVLPQNDLNCEHCMYAKKRTQLTLNAIRSLNI